MCCAAMSNRIAEMAKKKRGGGEEEDGKLRDKLRAFLRDRNESNQQRVTDLFNILDVDHSAKISKTELSRTLGEMGFVVTPKQMDMIFASFDVDKNGTIEYMEFFNFFRRTDEYPDLPPKPPPHVMKKLEPPPPQKRARTPRRIQGYENRSIRHGGVLVLLLP